MVVAAFRVRVTVDRHLALDFFANDQCDLLEILFGHGFDIPSVEVEQHVGG